MSMFGSVPANDMEARLHQLEQRAPSVEVPSIQVTVNSAGAAPAAVTTDPLDYNALAWESYSKFTATVSATGVPGGTWSDGPEGFLPPQAFRVGNVVFLSGLIRRTGATLTANTVMNSVMFLLPAMWRPARTVMLTTSCDTSGTPNTTSGGGRALLMVTPNMTQNSGKVTLVTASVGLTAGTGWVSLEGAFPAMFLGDPAV